jgi:hypothetical protein
MELLKSISAAVDYPPSPNSYTHHASSSEIVGHARSTGNSTATGDGSPLDEAESTTPDPSDGDYGWVAVVGGSIVSWWMIGIPYSWGIIQSALVDRGVSTPAVLSFVGSLAACLLAALAIVNSKIMRSFGSRGTGMLGMSMMGLANFITSFTFTNIGALFAASGVIMGMGIR